MEYNHYFKKWKNTFIDVYRVLSLFNVTDPCIQHAVKKLLVPGARGAKDVNKDVKEAIDSLLRFQQMREEDDEKFVDVENKEELLYKQVIEWFTSNYKEFNLGMVEQYIIPTFVLMSRKTRQQVESVTLRNFIFFNARETQKEARKALIKDVGEPYAIMLMTQLDKKLEALLQGKV
jgi:hypothetical protein